MNKYYTENPQIFDAVVQNLEARTWRPGFIDPCLEFLAKVTTGRFTKFLHKNMEAFLNT